MNNITYELQECIFEHCLINNISADIRFECFGDENKFYTNGTDFSLGCISYHTGDAEETKEFFLDFLDELWKNCKHPMNRIALYIEDIIDMGDCYDVSVGAGMFTDEALL